MRTRPLSLLVLAALSACDTVAFDDNQTSRPLEPQIPCDASTDCPTLGCKCVDGSTENASLYCGSTEGLCTGFRECESVCRDHGGFDQDFGSWLLGGASSNGAAGSGTAGSGTGGKAGSGTGGKAGSGGAGTCPTGGTATKIVTLTSPRPTLVAASPTEVFVIDGTSVVKVNGSFLVPQAAVPSPPKWLALAGSTLVAAAVDGIYTLPVAGGSWLKIVSATGVRALAPTGTNQLLYGWGVSGFPIYRIPLGGGPPTALTTTNQDIVLSIATSGSTMAWAAKTSTGYRLFSGSSVASGSATLLPELEDFVDGATYGGQLAATDGTSAFFVDPGGDVLSRVALTGGGAQALAPAVSSGIYHPLLLDGAKVFYTHHPGGCSGALMSIAKTGGTPTVVASGQDPYALATDGTNVYWLSGKDLYRAPK